ncbi:GNAT family N-acetyltransferase [Actinokineospora globicatena]|uniref:GNAT family N-acetyltransferase n=1 Tax=Actinokineospora globicatena TaxID=103729 RepID=UPI0020A4F297|nr:GNAT family N-acetyltransferase [Actinokineospora globicatena]MCP2304193.1 Acetyltransferase (GNAT) domain-containing protein [Actinokineospora globicatena]GLW78449.1 GCN5 family acetyltransferase [Actinokineospora globicatena]GLW84887.1 GCN5 family acetyltransferase [Actinokineospora globicatena]
MTFRLAPLLPDHVGEALTVQRAAYVSEAQRYTQPLIPPLVETVAEFQADLRVAIGAWVGHRLVGSVRGRVDGTRMEVARFSVAPDHQGTGVGRALLAGVEAAAPPEVTVFWLITGADSHDNQRLYGRAGYVAVGERTALGIRLLVMEKPR